MKLYKKRGEDFIQWNKKKLLQLSIRMFNLIAVHYFLFWKRIRHFWLKEWKETNAKKYKNTNNKDKSRNNQTNITKNQKQKIELERNDESI